MAVSDPLEQPEYSWAIEDIFSAHPNLYLEHFAVMAVVVMSAHSKSPIRVNVECLGFFLPEAPGVKNFSVRLSWSRVSEDRARRVLQTEQRNPIVERAALALSALMFAKLIPEGEIRVTRRGDRCDYWLPSLGAALEVSGTEHRSEMRSRHREKVLQLRRNPLTWPGYAVVCCFEPEGARVLWSFHESEGALHARTGT